MTIDSAAKVAEGAILGKNVTIGPFTIVHPNVTLGDNVVIESHCIIGHTTPLADGKRLVIGDNALVRSHSISYEGSTFGAGLRTGHHVTVREKIRAGLDLQVVRTTPGRSVSRTDERVYDVTSRFASAKNPS